MAPFSRRNVLLALLVAALVLPPFANFYHLFVANLVVIYVLLAIGLNILVGYAGQLAFANAAMFGIGAYATGLLQVKLGWSFWLAFPAGAMLAAAVGLAISLPALRLSGLYLALSTLAFAQATQWVFLHWESVTFGAGGFKTPPLSFAPLPIDKPLGLYYLSLVLTVGLFLFAKNLVASRVGRAFVAVRDGEVAAESLGVDLLRTKALAFGISGFYAGVAGGLYSAMLNFVAPEGFDLFQMVLQKAMIVVGGLGSITGSLLGAGVIIVLLEALRAFKGLQEIVFGGLLVFFVLFMRGGLIAVIKRHLSGWEEPLRMAGPAAAGSRARGDRRCPRAWPTDERHRPVRARPAHRLRWRQGAGRYRSRREARRDSRADRPQRRGQDHLAQRHLRHPPPAARRRFSRRFLHCRPQAQRHRATGAGTHVPDLPAVSRHDRPREHDDRSASPQPHRPLQRRARSQAAPPRGGRDGGSGAELPGLRRHVRSSPTARPPPSPSASSA